MSKITMAEVYRKLDIQAYDKIDEAKARGEELARFDFKDFSRAMRADDFITTQATLKAKWDSALADGIIIQIGTAPYSKGFINVKEFEFKLKKCVCVCVCEKPSAKKGVRA